MRLAVRSVVGFGGGSAHADREAVRREVVLEEEVGGGALALHVGMEIGGHEPLRGCGIEGDFGIGA